MDGASLDPRLLAYYLCTHCLCVCPCPCCCPCPPLCSTMSYILAPSLVAPRVCTKASAVMALTYQIAHILGLVIATGLAIALYGDIAGEL